MDLEGPIYHSQSIFQSLLSIALHDINLHNNCSAKLASVNFLIASLLTVSYDMGSNWCATLFLAFASFILFIFKASFHRTQTSAPCLAACLGSAVNDAGCYDPWADMV